MAGQPGKLKAPQCKHKNSFKNCHWKHACSQAKQVGDDGEFTVRLALPCVHRVCHGGLPVWLLSLLGRVWGLRQVPGFRCWAGFCWVVISLCSAPAQSQEHVGWSVCKRLSLPSVSPLDPVPSILWLPPPMHARRKPPTPFQGSSHDELTSWIRCLASVHVSVVFFVLILIFKNLRYNFTLRENYKTKDSARSPVYLLSRVIYF